MEFNVRELSELVRAEAKFTERIMAELDRVIVGQRYMIERLLLGLLCDGHVLLEGVPGLAKTLTVKSLAKTLDVDFQRLQFTPDLLPADLIGTMIYNQDTRDFSTKKGPIFTNLVLADEINRAPAKVQSALLEAMQEHQVTIGPTTHPLPDPFLVLATQNPLEQEGTYPLPEAQVDRFMLMITVSYPTREEERLIMDRMSSGEKIELNPVSSVEDILKARKLVNQIYLDDKIKEYIIDIIFATREPESFGLSQLSDLIDYGASPRASIYLNRAARAHAFLRQRGYVTPEDVKAVAPDVLRHRIILTYEAEAEEKTSEDVLRTILEQIEVP
ncbi:MAG: ATPase [Myxococcales bacterium]|nr:ATPase [Myxococcales bacterium]